MNILFISVKNKILYRRENLITIQKNVRMHLSKIKHRPRYMGIKKINSLKVSIVIGYNNFMGIIHDRTHFWILTANIFMYIKMCLN